MGHFTKKILSDDDKLELIDHTQLLNNEYTDIQKMANDLENEVAQLEKLNSETIKRVIIATITISKRLKEFRDNIREYRAMLTDSKYPLKNSNKNPTPTKNGVETFDVVEIDEPQLMFFM